MNSRHYPPVEGIMFLPTEWIGKLTDQIHKYTLNLMQTPGRKIWTVSVEINHHNPMLQSPTLSN